MNFQWEKINKIVNSATNTGSATYRAKVYGGWIVHDFNWIEKNPCSAMVFIPDPEHKWEITDED